MDFEILITSRENQELNPLIRFFPTHSSNNGRNKVRSENS